MTRVELRDSIGRLVKFIPGRVAACMVRAKTATIAARQRNGSVLTIQRSPGLTVQRVKGAPTSPTIAMYMGQRYTRRDEAHVIEFNDDKIHDDDVDLFRLAVTDNLVTV
jgi:hypothetical protein